MGIKISELVEKTTANSSDVIPVVDTGTKKMKLSTLLSLVFPIGSTYVTQTNTNPSTILGFGTWERLKGKVVVGLDEDDADGYFDEIGKTGGEKKHQLTIDELANHSHGNVYVASGNGNLQEERDWFTSIVWGNKKGLSWVGATGKDQAHNNIQPYEVVGYMWIRKS